MFVPGIVSVACPNAAHEICPKYIHFFVFLVNQDSVIGEGEEFSAPSAQQFGLETHSSDHLIANDWVGEQKH